MAQATLSLHRAETASEPDAAPDVALPSPRRRRLWVVPVVTTLLAVLWFAPAIVARSGLRHRLVHAVVPAYPGEASVGGASLGWLKPVALRDVSLLDAEGSELLRLGELRTSRSLAALVFAAGDDLGTVTIVRPVATIRLRAGGSNLEDVLRPLFEGEGSSAGMTVVVEDGSLRWTTLRGEPSTGGVEKLAVTVRSSAGASVPERLELTGELTDGEYGRDFSVRLAAAAGDAEGASELAVKATDLPLAPLQPWLDRFGVGVTLGGTASADLLAAVPRDADGRLTLDGLLEGRRLRVASSDGQGAEPLLFESMTLKGQGAVHGGAYFVESLDLRSPIGSLRASGEVRPASFGEAKTWPERLTAMLAQEVSIVGSLDLARVSSSLPTAWRAQKNFESGRVELEIRATDDERGRIGSVRIRTTEVPAEPPGRQVAWRDPFTADVFVRSGEAGVVVERLDVKTPFLTLAGSGSLAGAEAQFDADLDRLREALERLVELPEGRLSGRASGRLRLTRDMADGVVRCELAADATDLRIQAGGRTFDEPRVRLTGDAAWNRATGMLSIPAARLVSETASVEASDVQWPLSSEGASSGRIAIRGGIGRMARYLLPSEPPVWLSGVADGTVELRSDGATTGFDAAFKLERPVVSQPVVAADGRTGWRTVWSDEKASISVAGSYKGDTLELTSFGAAGTGVGVQGAGRVERLASVAAADLKGTLTYDLEVLRSRLAVGLPEEIVATGRGSKPFVLRGPLVSEAGVDPALTASLGVGWERLGLFGVTVGEGELSGRLERRTVAIQPFDWPLAEGRLRGSAAVSLDGEPVLSLAPGRVIDGVRLTPEMCARWLRYATPALADAAAVQGTVSADVVSFAMPLADSSRANAEGLLAIAAAEATPGPFARSLLEVVRQVQLVAGGDPTSGSDLRLTVPPQEVRVRVAGGRVFHDRFAVRLGDGDGPTVATSGSVGFDQTLDLVAEVTLDRGWFKDERVAAALGGQVLRVPVRGTLSRPMPDPRALQDFARQAAAGAAKGVLDQQIEKQIGDPLRKLFDR